MLRRAFSWRPRRLIEATKPFTSSGGRVPGDPTPYSHTRPSRGATTAAAAHLTAAEEDAEEGTVCLPRQLQQPQAQQLMERKPLAPPGFSRTFYKRQLPSPPAIEFASERGKQVFAEAMLEGTMNCFFKLIEQFRTQDEPAYCGLASLAMTLNTLNIDPRRTWKGPWRWFHEEMLDCCHPLPKVREEGITLTQAACLARCNGARVELYPHGTISLEDFRAMVAGACLSAEEHIIVSYSRKEFLQTGDGHFSPIGGYSSKEDMVLILDTARFKYPPHWVPLHLLYKAMAHIDPSTGRPRGFMRIGRHPRLDSVLFTLDVRDVQWREASRYAMEEMTGVVTAAAAAGQGASAHSVTSAAAAAAPLSALRKFIAVRTAGSSTHGGVCIQTAAVHTFLRELRSMPLYASMSAALLAGGSSSGGGDGHEDRVDATNCYTPGPAGTAGAAAWGKEAAAGCCLATAVTAAGGAEQRWACCAPQDPQQQQQQTGQQTGQQQEQTGQQQMGQTGEQQQLGSEQQHQVSDQKQQKQQSAEQQHQNTEQQQQQQQEAEHQQQDAALQATAAASSSPALAASGAEPAVKEDLTVERACMLLLIAPKEVWRDIGDTQLQQEVQALLDTSAHSVVAAEVEYLAAQLWQLPIMQQALEESEASGHTCGGAHCAAPGCNAGGGSQEHRRARSSS